MMDAIKIEFDVIAFETDVSNICGRDVTFTEAIVIWSEENNIEIEIISSIIKKNALLKARLEECARKRNLLKK